ncbi:hypothetical protein TRVL_05079 [Trypanosoma vivax]|nr:hypothetical protein TRVL_05079 [Trypanosoma vivax]
MSAAEMKMWRDVGSVAARHHITKGPSGVIRDLSHAPPSLAEKNPLAIDGCTAKVVVPLLWGCVANTATWLPSSSWRPRTDARVSRANKCVVCLDGRGAVVLCAYWTLESSGYTFREGSCGATYNFNLFNYYYYFFVSLPLFVFYFGHQRVWRPFHLLVARGWCANVYLFHAVLARGKSDFHRTSLWDYF